MSNESVDPDFTEGMDALVANHTVNTYIGAICAVINIPLILIFLTYKPFYTRFQILIALAFADFFNCLAIMFMGINRVELYSSVLETLTIPIRDPWECAVEPWLWLRGIGDLWPPIIQVMMGLERTLAVYSPVRFKRLSYKKRATLTVGFSIIFVVVSLIIGFAMAWSNRYEKVMYYCGRKAAFSDEYGTFIYTTNVAGYAIGFLLNFAAYCKTRSMTSTTEKNRSLSRLRYYILISLTSTVLVSIPNLISLTSVLFKKVSDAISKPAVWATCINSGLNFFVYLGLNLEFRRRCLSIIGKATPEIPRPLLSVNPTTSARHSNVY